MIRKALQAYANTRPIRPIVHEGTLILKRYFVFQLPAWAGGVRCYLHHFVGDDPDGLHNHPWKYGISLVLAGWYWDQRRWGTKKVRWLNVVNGDTLHRVLLPVQYITSVESATTFTISDNTSWSLFFHTPRAMDWAFVRELPVHFKHIYKEKLYEEVFGKTPTPYSDWYKTAPTGKEWEVEQIQLAQEQLRATERSSEIRRKLGYKT